MTDQERLSREQLVKRAVAAAGAVYAAPVLGPSARAAIDQRCRGKCSGDKTCIARGGPQCCCRDGRCAYVPGACSGEVRCRCEHIGPRCSEVEPCGDGFCLCFLNGREANPGACVEEAGGCQIYEAIGTCPGGSDAECPAGTVCFSSCCEDYGFPHLCGPCCRTSAAPAGGSARAARTGRDDGQAARPYTMT